MNKLATLALLLTATFYVDAEVFTASESNSEFQRRTMGGAEISDGYAFLYIVGSLVRDEEHKALAMARMLYYNINQIPHPEYPTALWLPPLEQRQFSVEEVKIAGRLIYESLDKTTQDIELLKYEALCSRESDLITAY